jgi:hypothetical protein
MSPGTSGRWAAWATIRWAWAWCGRCPADRRQVRERITRAEALDPRYASGGIPVAWGRYYAKMPWPKYDEKKARASYAKAMQINPNNLRARVFLAELMLEEDQPAEGRRLLEEVINAPVGKYDAPEEKRCKILAARA